VGDATALQCKQQSGYSAKPEDEDPKPAVVVPTARRLRAPSRALVTADVPAPPPLLVQTVPNSEMSVFGRLRCWRLLFLGIDAGPSLLISPRRSIASMANIKASTAEDGPALLTSSCSFWLMAFESLWFILLKILARHFPGSCSNALMLNPLYCMAGPGVCLHSGTQR